MSPFIVRCGLLTGLLCLGSAPAQPQDTVYLQGGVFTPDQPVQVQAYSRQPVSLSLRQVLDPTGLLTSSKNPRQPVLPKGSPTRTVKTVQLKENERLNLGKLAAGVYLLGRGDTQAVILVSTLGLVVKRDASGALTYTADNQDGQLQEAKVWAVGAGQDRQQYSSGGLARFKLSKQLERDQVFVAKAGNNWAISGAYWQSYAQEPKVRGYVYTDRPVYRPGQHVDFKAVLRRSEDLKPLSGQEVTLTVTSPDNEQLFRQTLKTNAYGSLSAGLELSEAARVGDYRFSIRDNRNEELNIYSSFRVEAYQKPEYEVTIKADRENVVQGDTVKVKVAANYLFGGAVSGARVKYRVVREPQYRWWWFDYDVADGDRVDDDQKLIVQKDARLDENGTIELSLPTERSRGGQEITYRIEAEVEDEARRPLSAQTVLVAAPSSLKVQLKTDGYVFDAGKPIPVHLETKTLADQGKSAPVLVELLRWDWVEQNGHWKNVKNVLFSQEFTTDAGGKLNTQLKAPKGGGYTLRATVKDPQGRKHSADNFVWVFKPGETWNWYSRELGVRFAEESYTTGDTATVLITNPNPGHPVLLTVEGDKLRSSVILKEAGAVLRYQFKVTDDMSPNIFVAAASFGGGQFYQGEQSVKVRRQGMNLKVNIEAAKAKYAPGDKGQFRISVQDEQGKGVASEVAFSVVDQAIYLIRPDTSTPMLDVFQTPRSNVVGTNSSTNFYFEGSGSYGAARSGGALAAPAPSTVTDLELHSEKVAGNATENPVTPRVDFRDTLLWIPQLVTDAQGRATVDLTFPDNLTTWIAKGRAHAQAPRFGEGQASTMTTKDVIARLSLPPFLVRQDQVTLSGIVNNSLGQPIQGQAKLDLSGLKGLGGEALSGTKFNIPAQGRRRFDITAQAQTLGQSEVTFTARTPQGSDALRLPLPVKARGYDMTVTSVGGSGTTLNLRLPADTAPESVKLRLDLTPSLLSAVAPALEYLVGYPYGCTEQTMSRFLPALLAQQALGENGLPAAVKAQLKEYTDVGLARLQKFQHQDGGWGFWEYDRSTLEMSAYVVEGLLRAKAAGAKVNNAMLDRGLNYLAQQVNDQKATQGEQARAYRVLALVNRVKLPELQKFAQRKDLSPYALALSALALHEADQRTEAQAVLRRLLDQRQSTSGGSLVYWQKPKDQRQWDWIWYWDDNDIQVTAAALEALATLEPQNTLIPRVSQWLLTQRRGQKWISTQDTANVIIAALKLPAAPALAKTNVQILLNDKQVGSVALQGRQGSTFNLSPALQAGQHTLKLKGAPASLIASAQLKFSREPAALNGIADQGLVVGRQYERLIPTWNPEQQRYVYAKTPVLNGKDFAPLKVGDLVLVTLTVESKKPARYLLVSDPIPAGMRALDDRSLAFAGESSRSNWYDWYFWYAGRDLLDDRVDLYANYLEGRQTMTYLLRAQTPGTFTALPSHAFLMYDPDVEGYAPAATFTVKDR